MVHTDTFYISTASGTTSQWNSCGLGNHARNLNEIGNSGKLNGEKMSRQDYLNRFVNTNKLSFTLSQTKLDGGDFAEAFTLTKSTYTNEDTLSNNTLGTYTVSISVLPNIDADDIDSATKIAEEIATFLASKYGAANLISVEKA